MARLMVCPRANHDDDDDDADDADDADGMVIYLSHRVGKKSKMMDRSPSRGDRLKVCPCFQMITRLWNSSY